MKFYLKIGLMCGIQSKTGALTLTLRSAYLLEERRHKFHEQNLFNLFEERRALCQVNNKRIVGLPWLERVNRELGLVGGLEICGAG